jgi:hypothetical protein
MLNDMEERIICSAIWYKMQPTAKLMPINIDYGVVLCGHRHPHIIYQMLALTGLRTVQSGENSVGDNEQGFLTNLNRFVNRKEAWIIAEKANQIINVSGGKCTLYSEDIY